MRKKKRKMKKSSAFVVEFFVEHMAVLVLAAERVVYILQDFVVVQSMAVVVLEDRDKAVALGKASDTDSKALVVAYNNADFDFFSVSQDIHTEHLPLSECPSSHL